MRLSGSVKAFASGAGGAGVSAGGSGVLGAAGAGADASIRSGLLPRENGISLRGFGARSTVRAFRSTSERSARGGGVGDLRSIFGWTNTKRADLRCSSSFRCNSACACCLRSSIALMNGSLGPSRIATRTTRWRLTEMRTTSRGDIGRGMVGVSGRWSSKSKYIRELKRL